MLLPPAFTHAIVTRSSQLAMMASETPPRRPDIFLVLFLISLIPYFVPYDLQPAIYHGLDHTEIVRRQKVRHLDKLLGGDSTKLGMSLLDEWSE